MKHFDTPQKEGFIRKLERLGFNLFPAVRGTGVFVTFISNDYKEFHLKLPLSWRTRNYVGTVFGGSVYASVDPIYMYQLIRILGKNYIVWDKAASIAFKKPIKSAVYARFVITDELIEEIKATVTKEGKMNVVLPINYEDKAGVIYAEITKTIYVASKEYYKNKPKGTSVG